jgi:ATPase subunit of ABC transporter with duplicated ATPase domains
MAIIINKISFGYSTPLLNNFSCTFNNGWSSIIGPNGCGKTTLAQIITGELSPDSGTIKVDSNIAYCSQLVQKVPLNFENFLTSDTCLANNIKTELNIEENWLKSWQTLSFGEQKKSQLACALFSEPKILILDEPTNHLDSDSKRTLLNLLSDFDGIGVLISHDRILLDELPYQTIFLDPPEYDIRRSGYSAAKKQRALEFQSARDQQAKLNKKIKSLKKQANLYQNMASSADKRKSKKNIHKKDRDAKTKVDAARLTGKDATHGKLYNQLQGRIKNEEKKLGQYAYKTEQTLNYNISAFNSRKRDLFVLKPASLKLGSKELNFESLNIRSGEKVALIGKNGSGKSSLLKYIHKRINTENTLYIPQELSMTENINILKQIHQLDSKEKGKIFTVLGSLGSEPKRVIYSENPSPGETRKLMLANAIRQNIKFIMMDEPTNHMDLDSIECLEKALIEYPGALLLVSHDEYFLENTTSIRWKIVNEDRNSYRLDRY